MTRLEPEYRDAFDAWQKSPGKQSTTALLTAVDPVLKTALHAYGGQKTSPTMASRARILAADSFSTYDPTRGTMRNHLMANLQRLRRHSAREQQAVRLPEAAALQRQHLATAEKQLYDTLGRAPSTAELADTTGVSRKRIEVLRSAIVPMAESPLHRAHGDAAGRFDMPVKPRATALPPWFGIAFDDLAQRDQFIVEQLMGLHGTKKQTPTQIAKALKISPAAISQRVARIQQAFDQWEDVYAR